MRSFADVVDLLKQLVGFPSLSHQEGPIADFITAYVRDRALVVERRGDNVFFGLGSGRRRLLLNSHLDVVPPSNDHPYDPFTPTVVDGRLYGRGAVDAKASVAAMTAAVVDLARSGWTPHEGQVIVALTTCEETGGGYNGLEDLRPHLPPLDAAIVGEPTDLQPCVAQKGLLILNVEAAGRTAHAARPHLGDNAVVRAARDVLRLGDLRLDRSDPFLGPVTVTVTTIEGGNARNVVPDRCAFTLDIRTTPSYTHDEILEHVAGVLESVVSVRSSRIVPVSTSLESDIVRSCLAAIPGAVPFGSPTASDWIFLKDVPAVKLGPGSSQQSHTAGEHILLSDVERAVDVYATIIRNYFSGQVHATA